MEKCSICQDSENLEKIITVCIELIQDGNKESQELIIDGKTILIEMCAETCPCENHGVIFTCICDHIVTNKRKKQKVLTRENKRFHFLCYKTMQGEIYRVRPPLVLNRPFGSIAGGYKGLGSGHRQILKNYKNDCENYDKMICKKRKREEEEKNI